MADELSDTQISLLCDIGQAYRYNVAQNHQDDISYLQQAGYLEIVHENNEPVLQLSKKATDFLSARGATLNES